MAPSCGRQSTACSAGCPKSGDEPTEVASAPTVPKCKGHGDDLRIPAERYRSDLPDIVSDAIVDVCIKFLNEGCKQLPGPSQARNLLGKSAEHSVPAPLAPLHVEFARLFERLRRRPSRRGSLPWAFATWATHAHLFGTGDGGSRLKFRAGWRLDEIPEESGDSGGASVDRRGLEGRRYPFRARSDDRAGLCYPSPGNSVGEPVNCGY